jgi:phage terminase large subunit
MAAVLSPSPRQIELPYNFTAWPHQDDVFVDFYRHGIRRFLDVWHRRAGKDKCWINLIVDQMMQRVGNYCHVLPQRTRARLIIWEAIDAETGMRLIDHFPEELIYRKVENEMYISLVHPEDRSREGSIYRAMGSDKDEHLLVGSNPVGIVWSEYPEINPRLRTLALPILRRNKGWEALCYTPRGGRNNHGCRLYYAVKEDPAWHVRYLTTQDTVDNAGKPLVTQADIDADIRAGMSREEADQEYGLSWDSPMPGAYYAAELRQAEKDGRIGTVDYDPSLPTYTAWDLGTNDCNSVWIAQPAGRELRVIDYMEGPSVALVPDPQHPENESWIQRVRSKPYNYDHSLVSPPLTRDKYEVHYGPHDLEVHEYSTNKTRYGHALEHGFRFSVLPHPGPGGLRDGIETARRLIGRAVFDAERCQQGLDALRSYRRARDEKTYTFADHPLHDWCLTGDTPVLTRHGTYQIMDLPITGEVLTSCGWKAYQHPRITRRNAPLVEVVFSDGFTVRCTLEHLFKTASGWKSAAFLSKGLLIQSSLTPLRSILMGISTAFIPRKPIFPREVGSFTVRCGRGLLALSRQSATCITRMKTFITMLWAILNAFPRLSIACVHGTSEPLRGSLEIGSLLKPMLVQTSGTGAKQGGCGIADKPSGRSRGRSGAEKSAHASFAGIFFRRLCALLATVRSIVARTAKPLCIDAVRPLPSCEDVWCLTVPGLEEFSLANGALVHNSSNGADAWRYLAVGLQGPGKPLEPLVPPNSFQFHRQNLKRAKLGLAPRSFRVHS